MAQDVHHCKKMPDGWVISCTGDQLAIVTQRGEFALLWGHKCPFCAVVLIDWDLRAQEE